MKKIKYNSVINHLESKYKFNVMVNNSMKDKIFDVQKMKEEFNEFDTMIENFIYDAIKNPDISCINSNLNIDFEGLTASQKLRKALLIDVSEFQEEVVERFALEKAIELAKKIQCKCAGFDYSTKRVIPKWLINELIELGSFHKTLILRAKNPYKLNAGHHISFKKVLHEDTQKIYNNYVKYFDIVYKYIYAYVLHYCTETYNFTLSVSSYEQLRHDMKKAVRFINNKKDNQWLISQEMFIYLKLLFEMNHVINHYYGDSRAIIAGAELTIGKCFIVNPIVDNLLYEVSKDTKESAINYKNICMMLQINFRQKLIMNIESNQHSLSFFFYTLFSAIDDTYREVVDSNIDIKHFIKDIEHYFKHQLREDFYFFMRSQDYERIPFYTVVDNFINAHSQYISDVNLKDINIFTLDILTDMFRHIHKLDNETFNFDKEYVDLAMNRFIEEKVLSLECEAWYRKYYESIYYNDFGEEKKPV